MLLTSLQPSERQLDNDAAVVHFINKILSDAIQQSVSDIHFEPYEQHYRIRYRQDGILHEISTPPLNMGLRIAARLKVMSALDVSERRIPQDGGFKFIHADVDGVDCRISSCPTLYGEKIVLRLQNAASLSLGIDSLGFNPRQTTQFLQAITKPQGLILVTGPTGSGKTLTLYCALNFLNQPTVNIASLEDPIEIRLPGINQVPIHPKTGLSFAKTLRAILRQDPDILMIGEIRDGETAEIAISAAQTGHLVLASLHTNSASESIRRLIHLGIKPFDLLGSLKLIIAQRLARRSCSHCNLLGCALCNKGYHGRVGLFELLCIEPSFSQAILAGGNPFDIFTIAKAEGMQTIYESGIEKIREGLTTLEEVERVTTDG